jgi:hypothetical protein
MVVFKRLSVVVIVNVYDEAELITGFEATVLIEYDFAIAVMVFEPYILLYPAEVKIVKYIGEVVLVDGGDV